MAKIIIGIHGLANKPRKSVLTDWWKRSIVEGLEKNEGRRRPRFRFEMVYWADLLHRHPQHRDASYAFDELYNREPYLPARPGSLRRYEDGRFDRIRADVREVAHRGVEGLKDTLGLGGLTDSLLRDVLQDLSHYWDDQRRIRDRNGRLQTVSRVLDTECSRVLRSYRDREILLIAHSMGCIISYNVLRDLGRQPRAGVTIRSYVTIGAPLGLSMVKDKTRRTRWDKKVRTPTIVTQQWVNFADKGDPVAFDSHLADDYGPNLRGVRVQDDLVLNDYHAEGRPNCHKAYGYLRTPEVSAHIARFLWSGHPVVV